MSHTEKKYYGQHGEDYLLWQLFSEETTGTFVEVGALDGIRFSNTYSFEQAGWTGLLVEAHPDYIASLNENRPNSIVVHAAAGEKNDTVTFHTNKRGSLSTLDPSLEVKFSTYGEYFTGFEPTDVHMRTLDTLLEEYGMQAPIDILSIDVEGAELRVLQGFSLDIYRPRVVVIETISDDITRGIHKYFISHGYHFAKFISGNLIYTQASSDAALISSIKQTIDVVVYPHILDENQSIKERTISLMPQLVNQPLMQPTMYDRIRNTTMRLLHKMLPYT